MAQLFVVGLLCSVLVFLRDASGETQRMGDTFQMSCSYDSDHINDNYLVQFYKEKFLYVYPRGSVETLFDNEPDDPTSRGLISLNGTKLNEFIALRNDGSEERYTVELERETNDSFVHTLTITDLQPEDSGVIGCQLVNLLDPSAPFFESQNTEDLTVPGPVLAIQLSVDDESVQQGAQIKSHEQTTHGVSARATCTNVVPEDISVFIGPDPNTRLLNFTVGNYMAHVNTVLDKTPLEKSTMVAHVLQEQPFTSDETYNGLNLYLLVKPVNFPLMSLSVVMNVTFDPTGLSCSEETVKAKESETASVVCQVKANPPADVPKWMLNGTDIDMTDGRYSITKEVDGDVTTATLTIRNVTSSDFGHYMLYAENEFGNTAKIPQLDNTSVYLTEDTSVSACVTASSLTVICMIIVTLASTLT